jgi:FdhD protein
LTAPEDLREVRHLGASEGDEIVVTLSDRVEVDEHTSQQGLVGASCGYCGRRNTEIARTPKLPGDDFTLKYSEIHSYSHALDACQSGFNQTGGLHAAALIGADGTVEGAFEDIGRHNALDKLLGSAFLQGRMPLSRFTVFLSSRSSFELVHKAATAGVPVLATIGGPSSLAIELARECGMTLAGFVRNGSMNVYSGEWRLHSES